MNKTLLEKQMQILNEYDAFLLKKLKKQAFVFGINRTASINDAKKLSDAFVNDPTRQQMIKNITLMKSASINQSLTKQPSL